MHLVMLLEEYETKTIYLWSHAGNQAAWLGWICPARSHGQQCLWQLHLQACALIPCPLLRGVITSTVGAEGFHFSGGYTAFVKGGVAPCHICPGFVGGVTAAGLLNSWLLCELDVTTMAQPRIPQMFPPHTGFSSVADGTLSLQCRGSKIRASQCPENKNKSIRTLHFQVYINPLCTLGEPPS